MRFSGMSEDSGAVRFFGINEDYRRLGRALPGGFLEWVRTLAGWEMVFPYQTGWAKVFGILVNWEESSGVSPGQPRAVFGARSENPTLCSAFPPQGSVAPVP